jgi:hypothetical protein
MVFVDIGPKQRKKKLMKSRSLGFYSRLLFPLGFPDAALIIHIIIVFYSLTSINDLTSLSDQTLLSIVIITVS